MQWEKSPTGSVVTRKGSMPRGEVGEGGNEAEEGKLERNPDGKERCARIEEV